MTHLYYVDVYSPNLKFSQLKAVVEKLGWDVTGGGDFPDEVSLISVEGNVTNSTGDEVLFNDLLAEARKVWEKAQLCVNFYDVTYCDIDSAECVTFQTPNYDDAAEEVGVA